MTDESQKAGVHPILASAVVVATCRETQANAYIELAKVEGRLAELRLEVPRAEQALERAQEHLVSLANACDPDELVALHQATPVPQTVGELGAVLLDGPVESLQMTASLDELVDAAADDDDEQIATDFSGAGGTIAGFADHAKAISEAAVVSLDDIADGVSALSTAGAEIEPDTIEEATIRGYDLAKTSTFETDDDIVLTAAQTGVPLSDLPIFEDDSDIFDNNDLTVSQELADAGKPGVVVETGEVELTTTKEGVAIDAFIGEVENVGETLAAAGNVGGVEFKSGGSVGGLGRFAPFAEKGSEFISPGEKAPIVDELDRKFGSGHKPETA
jgi:hypothetical protein